MSETGLLNPASIRRIADQIGLRPTKTRGQNFVHDANTVRRIVSLAQVGAADRVIEVGPGLGSLTLGLLETGAEVVAIEIDEVLANQLPGTVAERMPGAAERLEVVLSDALDVKVIPPPWWRTCRIMLRFRCCCTCWQYVRSGAPASSWCSRRWPTDW